MATSYHVKRGNKINGPFGIEELRKLFKAQKIRSDDGLAQSPEGPWKRLATVLTEFSEEQSGASPQLQDGAGVDRAKAKVAKARSAKTETQQARGDDDDNFLSALSSAVSQTAKMPSIEETPPEEKQVQRKVKKGSRANVTGNPFSVLASLYSDNQPFSAVAVFLLIFVIGTVGAVAFMKQMAAPIRHTRIQKEYMGKTLGKWLELEAEGKARHSETLWKDSRWMPLDSVVGLDYAALPEVFDGLTKPETRELALTILGKMAGPGESPYYQDLEKGLRHSDPLVAEWAARMAAFYKGEPERGSKVSEVIALLDAISSSGNREAGTAALESITVLKGPAK